jgi:hypothetical protein
MSDTKMFSQPSWQRRVAMPIGIVGAGTIDDRRTQLWTVGHYAEVPAGTVAGDVGETISSMAEDIEDLRREVSQLRALLKRALGTTDSESAPTLASGLVLETFIAAHNLMPTVQSVTTAAVQAFGGDHITVEPRLAFDADLGGDFVKLDIGVTLVDRNEFRRLRATFAQLIETLPDADRLSRIVITVSRRG